MINSPITIGLVVGSFGANARGEALRKSARLEYRENNSVSVVSGQMGDCGLKRRASVAKQFFLVRCKNCWLSSYAETVERRTRKVMKLAQGLYLGP